MNNYAILYYSKNGTTRETVDRILAETSNKIDVFDLKDTNIDLSPYKTLFVGCGIYAGKLPSKVGAFFTKNKEILASKKIILFIHGLISQLNYNDVVNQSLNKNKFFNFNKIFFLGGKLDYQKQNLAVKALFKVIAKKNHLDLSNANNLNEIKIAELVKCF